MLAASNSSLVYDTAFGVYAYLTMAPVVVNRAIYLRHAALDEYVDRSVEAGGSNEIIILVYAVDGILIELYETAWQNAAQLQSPYTLDNWKDLALVLRYMIVREETLGLPCGVE